MRLAIYVVAFSFVAITMTRAETGPPFTIGPMGHTDPDIAEWMEGRCEAVNPGRLHCELVSVSIRPQTKPQEVPQKLEEALQNREALAEELRSSDMCDDELPKLKATIDAELTKLDSAKLTKFRESIRFLKSMIQEMVQLCKQDFSPEAFESFASLMLEKEARTCKLFPQKFSVEFELQRPNTWVSNQGPSGLCQTIIITQLTRDPEHELLWEYEERRIYLNKTGFLCEGSEDQTERFSWRSGEKVLHCDFVDFGF
jgi:hypothetical protein